ncbi:MAG: acyltransferase, partial [Cryobacterium sp.]|nr:acyltransferase [Cryobacterium sp.]
FVLSGLLITGILLDTRGKGDFFRSFYLRRTLRIFPLYYAYVAGVVFVAAPLAWSAGWAAEVRAEQWPYWVYLANWTQPYSIGVHGMSHLWSLAVEEQFYLVWPLAVYALGRRGTARLALTLVIAGLCVRYVLTAGAWPKDATYCFTIARWDALAAGALLAAMLRDERGRALVAALRGKLTVLLVLSLLALVAVKHGFHSDDPVVAIIGQSLIVGLSFCLLAFAADASTLGFGLLQRILCWRGSRTLGKYSYAMYIFHFPIHHSLKLPLGLWVAGADDSLRIVRVLAYLTLILILAFGASLLSWRLIEKPFLDLKEKWAPRADTIPPGSDRYRATPREESHAPLETGST